MTAAELKASILDLAIRGKLVAQDPDDEPASELLARIAGEKVRLIKEKKIKKEKPLDPIVEDELPFELPSGWAWCRLGDLVTIRGGKRLPVGRKLVDEDTGIKYVRISDMKSDYFVSLSDIKYVPVDVYPKIKAYIIKKEDVYVTVAGTIGRVGRIPAALDGANLTENADRLILYRIDQVWLIYCLASFTLQNQIISATKQVGQPKLSIENLARLQIPLPPLAEQKRIVEKVEELMPLVDRYEKAEAKRIELEKALPGDLEKSILQEAIQGKLVAQDPNDEPASELLARIAAEKAKLVKEKKIKREKPLDPIDESEVPFALPKGWAWCRLGEICKTISGVSYQKGDVGKEKGVRILRGGNVKDGAAVILRDDDVWLPASYRDGENAVELGDVIVVASTGSSAVIGRPGIVRDKYDNAQIGAFLRIVRCNDKSCQGYIHLIFQSEYYRENIRKAVKGIGIKNLKAEYITSMVIPLPPLAEQKRIVAKVDELLGAIRRLH